MTKQFFTMGVFLGLGIFACVGGVPGWAADQRPFEFTDLEVGLSSAPMPKIKEYTTDGIGTKTEFDWQGERSAGLSGNVIAMRGAATANGGWEFGLGVSVSNYDITPNSYAVDGNAYNNGSGQKLYYRTAGIEVLGGYEYGVVNNNDFSAFIEMTPLIGVGPAWAENAEYANGAYETKRGTGWYADVGLRLAAFITEQRWIYGVTLSLIDHTSQIKMSFPGYKSTLELNGIGFGAGVVAGYRY
jgi:hypothetical protein